MVYIKPRLEKISSPIYTSLYYNGISFDSKEIVEDILFFKRCRLYIL